jgi:hypothetical protein
MSDNKKTLKNIFIKNITKKKHYLGLFNLTVGVQFSLPLENFDYLLKRNWKFIRQKANYEN